MNPELATPADGIDRSGEAPGSFLDDEDFL
jgi:hypothetical protein